MQLLKRLAKKCLRRGQDSPRPPERFDLNTALERTRSIRSNLTQDEMILLYELATGVESGVIVEVGSFHGRSTAVLSYAVMEADTPIYAIDPHEDNVGVYGGVFHAGDRRAFFENMIKTQAYRNVRLINLDSHVAAAGWRPPIGLLWLDGDHTLEGVRLDIEGWFPHLLPGAKIAFHDATDPDIGPHQVIPELLNKGYTETSGADRIRVLIAPSP
ncbi:MAG: class I SAM-dependent methyltransferase [Planctomycetota bacterium]